MKLIKLLRCFKKVLAVLHLRKPTLSEDETIEFLNTIPEQYHERIVIHQHYKCINTYNLKGIHFPEAIRKDSSLMQGYLNYFGDKGISISTSFHSPEALLGKQEAIFQYAFLVLFLIASQSLVIMESFSISIKNYSHFLSMQLEV